MRIGGWISGAASALVVAACGGGSEGTGPDTTPVVTTIQVTVESAMLVGDSLIATAVVRDQFGNAMTKAVTWSSSTGAATISTDGIVSGAQAGTAVISASAEGKTGSANVSVGIDERFGYVWANDQASASYLVDNGYVHNSSGGAVSITRSGTGSYAVTFAGLAPTGAQRTGVQVSAYSSGSAHCKTSGWRTSGADLVVDVRCFSTAGVATDARYTVLATGATAMQGRLGFAYGDNASAAAMYSPAQARSSRGKGIRVTRASAGTYTVDFDGLSRGAGDGPEQLMVTAVGDGSERCTIQSWSYAGFGVTVLCYNSAGALADSKFSLLLIEKSRAGRKLAFSWANDPFSGQYTPSTLYTMNDGGGATEIVRNGVGSYTVTFTGLARTTGAAETVLITAYGGGNLCRIGSWGGGFAVSVACYDATGAPIDSRFDIIVVQ